MECKYCNNKFSNSSSLNKHIKNANYCINKRGPKKEIYFICEGCNINFISKYNLTIHISVLKKKISKKSIMY